MDELEEVWSGLVAFTTRHGLLSVAAIQFLKSAGVPLPVPSGLFTVPLGVRPPRHALTVARMVGAYAGIRDQYRRVGAFGISVWATLSLAQGEQS